MFTVRDLSDIVRGKSQTDSANLSEIQGISVDSRTIKKGEVFFAIPGTMYDGSEFILDALKGGAVCAVSKSVPRGVDSLPIIVVEDPIDALSKFSADFFGDPSSAMEVVGITGTNGKTTITYILESIAKHVGTIAGVIGTINYRVGDFVLREGLTTPFPQDIQSAMAWMKSMGSKFVFMEVSSHGLAQRRVSNIHFDAGIFTNLTRDHLDYHGDMENYYQAKKTFFTDILPCRGGKSVFIINIDSPFGRRLAGEIDGNIVTFGISKEAHITASNPHFSIDGIKAVVETPVGEMELNSKLIGSHNLQNLLASVTYAHLLGFDREKIASGVLALKSVPGRLERVEVKKPVYVFVDYAHTPDGLQNVLSALNLYKQRRLIVVFGCGGDRDRGKRAYMGAVAGSLSDVSVITSDNPRTEDPFSIIEEIIPGCERAGAKRKTHVGNNNDGERVFLLEPDRKKAIFLAVDMAREGDIVVIAGKGHEPYQIIGEGKIDFDDREVIRSIS